MQIATSVRSSLSCLSLAGLLGVAGGAGAQQVPDAGVLQQQIDRDRRVPLPALGPAPKPPAPGDKPVVSGPTVTVKRFEYEGNTLLSAERLDAAVASYLNRPLSFAELQAAAAAVAEVYRAEGWTVRTLLPKQDLSGGSVKIEIIEAISGEIRINRAEPTPELRASGVDELRVSLARIRAIAARALPPGQPVSNQAIDRALLLLEDLPGISVQGSLVAGRGDRETDLVLIIDNKPLLSGDARTDNTGSLSTGRQRYTGNLALASPSGNADLLALNLLHTEGSNYGRLAYTLPLGYDGWTAGVNASDMRYQVIPADFAALVARGSSGTAGLEANYPLWRSRLTNLLLNLAVDHKNFNNLSGGEVTTHYRITTVTATLNANVSDSVGGGGRSSASLGMTQGKVDLAASPNFAADAATTRTNGRFVKLRYSLSRQQLVSETISMNANLSGQLAGKNLDSGEKFYLGGSSGVRAYPSSEGGGSDGQMLNLEANLSLPLNLKSVFFYDWGHVRVNRDNDFDGAPALNSLSLRGAGVSFAWDDGKGLSARLTWARRIGDNPNPTAAGKDQDGTLIKNRIWLTAGYAL